MSGNEAPSLQVLVFGTTGRMARAISQALMALADVRLCAAIPARDRSAAAVTADVKDTPSGTVVCDFTHPRSFDALMSALESQPRPLVLGTSGLDPDQKARLRLYSGVQPVMYGSNFSPGAVIAQHLIGRVAKLAAFDRSWQAAVLDFHHDQKVEAQSATALDWASRWEGGSDGRIASISAIRLGNGVSEHSFLVAGDGERLEIAHRILSRAAPAAGAIAAARFLVDRGPGLYEPKDFIET